MQLNNTKKLQEGALTDPLFYLRMHTQYNETMLDLETLGRGNEAAIISIGAVPFNLHDEETYESIQQSLNDRTFYRTLTLRPLKGDVDGDVLEWWFQQSDKAREVFKPGSGQKTSHEAIIEFEDWLAPMENGIRGMWANGCGFDNIILRSAYDRERLRPSWSFRKDFDMRTIKYLALLKEPDVELNFYSGTGVQHNALDDAIRQVLLVQRCWRAIKGTLKENERKAKGPTSNSG